ncbi:YggS family pyridoxal phosphate-dependent enzyme [Candidatus Njordibacter sp. Uisw_039]|jgi:pyridoxal phosphate enzyme (YggS family)|uniref:YggS family pyridoxal phosphate-dependent enzyme n=1 Tax=Candidatus Njordibacter sp. Uisw_039 TaxID=3230972 RepID=UPI003A3978D3|tara:strand:- start:2864 stop:3583 length:720 start_codon:yes stop_codon:yes gene_type:complete
MTSYATQQTIPQALIRTQQRINEACQASSRLTHDVMLLAVSKTKPLSAVIEAYNHGQRHFGENYLQDALEKIEGCPHDDIEWHFIGAIQSNKTKSIAAQFDWVHTLDRDKIARRLSQHRPSHLPPLKVLIQVNISNESNKNGVPLKQLEELVDQVSQLPNLLLCGLMCIPAAGQTESSQHHAFNKMAAARDQLNHAYPQIKQLSMGMSGDLTSAIACGSTIVRIGTDIFGARNTLNPEL